MNQIVDTIKKMPCPWREKCAVIGNECDCDILRKRVNELLADYDSVSYLRDKLLKENENLKKIIAQELSENDELGSEFVFVNILRRANSKLAEALNWIGAIRVSPKNSWPTHEIIAQVANEALEKYHGGK